MEEERLENAENIQETETVENPQANSYAPRPAYQVWAARIGVGIVRIGFIMYCLHIAGIGI